MNSKIDGIPYITEDEERNFQFATFRKAQAWAQHETQATGIKHEAILSTTWRDLEMRWCYTVRIAPRGIFK